MLKHKRIYCVNSFLNWKRSRRTDHRRDHLEQQFSMIWLSYNQVLDLEPTEVSLDTSNKCIIPKSPAKFIFSWNLRNPLQRKFFFVKREALSTKYITWDGIVNDDN